MRVVLMLIIHLFISVQILAQSTPQKTLSIDAISSLIGALDQDDYNYEEMVENLVHILNNPIDLNATNPDELTELLILSPKQITAIINYAQYNKFHSIYELQLIPSLDYNTIQLITPFFTVYPAALNASKWKLTDMFKYKKQMFITRLDVPLYTKKAFKGAYYGPKYYNSFKYSYESNKHLYVGVAGEKDAGEALFGPYSKQGYDYYTYYILLKDVRNLEYLALGKYKVSWGQGLLIGTNQFGSKFDQLNHLLQGTNKVYKHSSFDEFNYMNGIAASLKLKRTAISALYSRRLYDGEIEGNNIIKWSKTGLHRTQNEVLSKNKITSNILGLRLSYTAPHYFLAVNSLYYTFNGRHMVDKGQPYTRYNPQGNVFYNYSLDFGYYFNKVLLKGEIAKGRQGYALLTKLYYAPTTDHELLFIYRDYSKEYWAIYAKSFGEQSAIRNERGYFFSYSTTFINPLKASFYGDYFKSPWWRYRVSKPSSNLEFGAKLEYKKAVHQVNISYRYLVKERDQTASKGKVINKVYVHKYQLNYFLDISPLIRLKTSIGYNFQHELLNESGCYIAQKATLLTSNTQFKIDVQGSYFYSQSYDTRAFIYENSLLYSFSSFSFSGKGCRGSLNLNYKPIDLIHLNCKWGITKYFDRGVIGQGNDEIDSSYKMDIQLQLKLKF